MGLVSDLYATATPTPNVIPISDGSATLNDWVTGFMANPMTNWQDMIVGGLLGVPTRLAVGSVGYVLTVGSSGEIGWAAATGGFSNPMTSAEDIIVGGVAGAPTRLPHGYVGQVLTVGSGGYLDWENGFTNPMTAAEDLIVGGVAGAPSRLPVGYVGQVLTVGSGGYLDWESPSAGVSPHNPTGMVGLSAVNGVATTYMRSDAAPPLDQSISPTWTGTHLFNHAAGLTGAVAINANSGVISPGANAGALLVLQEADSTPGGLVVLTFGQFGSVGGYRAAGTNASKTATASGNELFRVGGGGYYTDTGGAYQSAFKSYVAFYANEAWTSTANGTRLKLLVTPNGSTSSGVVVDVDSTGVAITGVLSASGHVTFEGVTSTGATGTGKLVFGTAPVFSSTIEVGTAAGTTGLVKLNGTTSGVVSLTVNDVAGTWTMKLPATAGSSGYLLSTDGAGVCSWSAPTGAGDFLALQVFF